MNEFQVDRISEALWHKYCYETPLWRVAIAAVSGYRLACSCSWAAPYNQKCGLEKHFGEIIELAYGEIRKERER